MNKLRCAGFTLLELIVTMLIIAILTAMAVTTWQRHVERGWRAQARAALMTAMLELERHALTTMTFADRAHGEAVAGTWPKAVPAPPARPRHLVSAQPCPDAGLDLCVELHALPQTPDAECGALILRSTGEWLAVRPPSGQTVAIPPGC
jgi:type IV pilus assembly protein PilE